MARKTTRTNASDKKHLVPQSDLEVDMTLEEMLEEKHNRYLLVNLVARRSRDLNRGSRALVDLPPPHTWTELARAEVETGKLKIERKPKSKVFVNLIDNE
jgi:DNA-directed RNA polymerase subunit K/omega